MSKFNLSSYNYPFDESLIAKYPCNPRDSSRLMVVNRATGEISELIFREIVDLFGQDDTFIFNNTKVIPARLIGKRSGEGNAEVFLIKPLGEKIWEVMAKPGKKLKEGSSIYFGNDFFCNILSTNQDGTKIVEFVYEENFESLLEKYGQIPLPHYMNRNADEVIDSVSYQTVYAKEPGAVAAPTAGLHFTETLLYKMSQKKIAQETITLHVGLGTFQPVRVEDVREHQMHLERCFISPEVASSLNAKKNTNHRQVCVGTTSCRALESAANQSGLIVPGNFETDIFIYPGYSFKFVQILLTNFHLPGSTLLMLVSAFAGYDLIMEAYAKAVKERYRFFSYGDAMLIL